MCNIREHSLLESHLLYVASPTSILFGRSALPTFPLAIPTRSPYTPHFRRGMQYSPSLVYIVRARGRTNLTVSPTLLAYSLFIPVRYTEHLYRTIAQIAFPRLSGGLISITPRVSIDNVELITSFLIAVWMICHVVSLQSPLLSPPFHMAKGHRLL